MGLPTRYPVIEKGDSEDQFEAWRLVGFSSLNTEDGKLYPSSEASGDDVTITLYSDFDRSVSVATGTGSVPGRITISEANDSGISGSVYANTNAAQAQVELVVQLCTELDLRNAEENLDGLLLEDETDFSDVLRRTAVEFYTLAQAKVPPTVTVGDDLHIMGGSSQIPGRDGQPDTIGSYLWTLNREHNWELTGLSNPEDFREWAIQEALGRIWLRKAHGADDPKMGRAIAYKQEADRLWGMLKLWVDADQDLSPDRPVEVKTFRIGRG